MLQSLDFLRLFPLTRSRSGGRVLGCPCVTLVLPSLLFKLADVEKEKGSILVVGIVSGHSGGGHSGHSWGGQWLEKCSA